VSFSAATRSAHGGSGERIRRHRAGLGGNL
jgi:hypothetical protein